VRTLAADLARDADLRRVEAVLRDDASITLLVNNAGVYGGSKAYVAAFSQSLQHELADQGEFATIPASRYAIAA